MVVLMRLFFAFFLFVLLGNYGYADIRVNLKEVGRVLEARDNQLLGYGLVVGVKNTGDSKSVLFTNKALTNLLDNYGIRSSDRDFSARNVASVMVTSDLLAYKKKGQRIDVTVSAVGDATSIEGGTLLLTELKGVNHQTYAMAQGPVVIAQGGLSITGRQVGRASTVGRISNGAIIEREIPVSEDDTGMVTFALNDPDFVNASRVADALVSAGFKGAFAKDPTTIKIPIDNNKYETLVGMIAALQGVTVLLDSPSKVVVNSQTGTVVIGQNVKLFPVALTHGDFTIRIDDESLSTSASIRVRSGAKLVHLEPQSTLASLVKALNQIGASPRELVDIIQALKESRSLIAEVQVL